jgi:two-component system, sensor histidine kinase and response regulator
MKSVSSQTSVSKDHHQGTALVVDDNPDNLRVVTEILFRAGVDVRFSQSGEEALELARTYPPDVILLDIEMPGMDGYEVCTRLKETPETAESPVLFLTAHDDEEHLVRGFEVGGVDYIIKPVRQSELLSRVQTHLELKRAKDELRLQNHELSRLNSRKDRFFSMLAHDLRNPFGGFLSLVTLLNERQDELEAAERREMLTVLLDTATRLNQLLDNLLEWGRLQLSQAVPLTKGESCPLGTVVEDSVQLFQQNAEQKGITIQRDVPGDMTVYADRSMVMLVVRNLLSNAIKFSHPGGTVDIRARSDDGTVTFSVSDGGVGIPKDRLETLFSDESQQSRAGTTGEKGTGLGLSLCRLAVNQNGGTISVESEERKGTTFFVSLPRDRPEP